MERARLIAVLALVGACTEANFFVPPIILERPLDNQVQVAGGFCAEGADDLKAFLKLMFIIDRSNSMQVTDPNNRRVSAVAEVVTQFIDNPATLTMREGVEIALIPLTTRSATSVNGVTTRYG